MHIELFCLDMDSFKIELWAAILYNIDSVKQLLSL